jgi:hypothetical protein
MWVVVRPGGVCDGITETSEGEVLVGPAAGWVEFKGPPGEFVWPEGLGFRPPSIDARSPEKRREDGDG